MKKKIMPLAFTFVLGSFGFSQTENVGVNTDTPEQTLDVNGTVRVSTLGQADPKGHLVGWNKDNQQVVDLGEFSLLKLFKKKHYKIDVSNQENDAHNYIGVEDYNLGINSKKYSIIITEPKLVYRDKTSKTVFINTVAVADKDGLGPAGGILYNANDDGWLNRVTNITSATNLGYISAKDRWHTFQGTLVKTGGLSTNASQKNPLLYEVPKIIVYKSGDTWRFTAKYYYSGSADYSVSSYSWVFDVLIIDNSWVKYTENVRMTIKNNPHDGTPHDVVPDNPNQYPDPDLNSKTNP